MTNETSVMTNENKRVPLHEQDMATSSSSGSVSEVIDGYSFDPSALIDFFDPLYFEPIISWEYDMVEALRAEQNSEELEWLVCLFYCM